MGFLHNEPQLKIIYIHTCAHTVFPILGYCPSLLLETRMFASSWCLHLEWWAQRPTVCSLSYWSQIGYSPVYNLSRLNLPAHCLPGNNFGFSQAPSKCVLSRTQAYSFLGSIIPRPCLQTLWLRASPGGTSASASTTRRPTAWGPFICVSQSWSSQGPAQ